MDYLIPRNVQTRFEFWAGFGFIELGVVAAAGLVSFLCAYLLHFFVTSIIVLAVTLISPPGLVYYVMTPGISGRPLYKLLFQFFRWKKSQRRYIYKFGTGRG